MSPVYKFENIFMLDQIEKQYKYMWYLRDRCWCEEKTLKLMYKAISEEYDLIFLDVGHPEYKKENYLMLPTIAHHYPGHHILQ